MLVSEGASAHSLLTHFFPVLGFLRPQFAGSCRSAMPWHASWQRYPAAPLERGAPL